MKDKIINIAIIVTLILLIVGGFIYYNYFSDGAKFCKSKDHKRLTDIELKQGFPHRVNIECDNNEVYYWLSWDGEKYG